MGNILYRYPCACAFRVPDSWVPRHPYGCSATKAGMLSHIVGDCCAPNTRRFVVSLPARIACTLFSTAAALAVIVLVIHAQIPPGEGAGRASPVPLPQTTPPSVAAATTPVAFPVLVYCTPDLRCSPDVEGCGDAPCARCALDAPPPRHMLVMCPPPRP